MTSRSRFIHFWLSHTLLFVGLAIPLTPAISLAKPAVLVTPPAPAPTAPGEFFCLITNADTAKSANVTIAITDDNGNHISGDSGFPSIGTVLAGGSRIAVSAQPQAVGTCCQFTVDGVAAKRIRAGMLVGSPAWIWVPTY
jgi:hypothetical protein